MRSAFLIFIISFFQLSYAEPLSSDALKACARQLIGETSKAPSHYTDLSFLPTDLLLDLEATVLFRLDASLVPPHLMQIDLRYSGILSPNELIRVNTDNRTVFFVVHGSRENLTVMAQDLMAKFPSRSLSYRILLSRPHPFPNSPPFFRANGLNLALAEAIETCFFSACAVSEDHTVASTVNPNEPSDLTIVTKEARDNMIAFLRAHASSEDMAKINIATDFGLLKLIKDIMVQASGETAAKINKVLATTEPKKSDGTGFRANNPKAVERVLEAWILMVKSLDETLLADPISEKTLAALDKVFKEKIATRKAARKRKST